MGSSRSTLLTTSVLSTLFGLLAATSVVAQDIPPQAEPQATIVDEVIVTGSRIPRPNLEQPTPVATISSEAIETSGTQDLGSIIAELPSLSSNSTVRGNSDSFGDSGGLNFPDLRSLGSARTLTLIDGKRHVGGDAGNAAVDLNAIPAGLVERVEVITGGASAIYGSDAVSGVINIILKDDFEGAEFTVQGGGSEDGAGRNYSANGVLGRNFMNDRANATISLFYDHSDQVMATDIPALRDIGSILNPNDTGPDDGIFDRILVPNVFSDFLDESGVILDNNTFDIITAILPDGTPVPQQPRLGTNSFAFGSFNECDTCVKLDDYVVLIPETDRYGANVRLRYDLTNNVTAYLDAKYVRSEIFDFVQPSFTFGDYFVEPDNAFITPELAAVIAGRDITFGRFNNDIGPRINDITRETYRVVAGLRGVLITGSPTSTGICPTTTAKRGTSLRDATIRSPETTPPRSTPSACPTARSSAAARRRDRTRPTRPVSRSTRLVSRTRPRLSTMSAMNRCAPTPSPKRWSRGCSTSTPRSSSACKAGRSPSPGASNTARRPARTSTTNS